jgi:hypothetical protein
MMGKLEAIRARHEDVPDVLALCDEAERLRGYKEREDQEGVHIHHCPRQGESVTPCCGKTPFEIPGWHRMTAKPELVNCGRLELEAEVKRLRDERATLFAEVERLRGENEELRNEVERLEADRPTSL